MASTDQTNSGELKRARTDLLIISVLSLFLELACIRWFSSHVVSLTFFTNVILLASFLGMSLGCLAARRNTSFINYTPALILLGMLCSLVLPRLGKYVTVNVLSAQFIFFGTQQEAVDPSKFPISVEVLGSFFFALLALAFVGIGQEVGRTLNNLTDRLQAYSINILGSIFGIVLLSLCSWAQLSPLWWFSLSGLMAGVYFWRRYGKLQNALSRQAAFYIALLILPLLSIASNLNAVWMSGNHEFYWSPYYRITYSKEPERAIGVNLITHQEMVGLNRPYVAYALPHMINRDAGGQTFKDVLIIGAGSGNDVARALQWGATHVDAVEIDPVIYRLGREHHPDSPYNDPRVSIHLDDGRNFLRSTTRKYDLVIFALLDSLMLHSGYSSIRLESYLFTLEAFSDVKSHLKPDGIFAMYNYFRKGWLVNRIEHGAGTVFEKQPLVFTLPYIPSVDADLTSGGYTFVMVGNTDHIKKTFSETPNYHLSSVQPPTPNSPNGFLPNREIASEAGPLTIGLTKVVPLETPLRSATDNWPFLYLRSPELPGMTMRGMMIMGTISLILIFLFVPRGAGSTPQWSNLATMFFLGAGFMLMESKSVAHMALLFGSTWIVNSIVFFAVLVMIFAGNMFLMKFKPTKKWPFYVGILASLGLHWAVPLGTFLGMPREVQILLSCLLVFTPIFFAALIFGMAFRESKDSDLALGANIAGAVVGGLLENLTLLLGFQNILLVAIAFYLLSLVAPLAFKKMDTRLA